MLLKKHVDYIVLHTNYISGTPYFELIDLLHFKMKMNFFWKFEQLMNFRIKSQGPISMQVGSKYGHNS